MQEMLGQLGRASRELLVLVAAAVLAPVIVAVDLVVLENGISEVSMTESFQEILLLLCVLLFGYKSMKVPQTRGALVLITGFFLCLLIRELDFFFDTVLWHGAWIWPVALIVLTSCWLAYRNNDTLFQPATSFLKTRSYVFVMIGFVTLFVFSRIFGSGSLLWESALGEAYNHEFKSALQEGLELFAYAIITQGALLFCRTDWISVAGQMRAETAPRLSICKSPAQPWRKVEFPIIQKGAVQSETAQEEIEQKELVRKKAC